MFRSLSTAVIHSLETNRRRIFFVAVVALVAMIAGAAALPLGIFMIGEMNPEDGNGPEGGKKDPDPNGKGNPDADAGKPGDGGNPDRNVQALHAKLTERDKQLKAAQAELARMKDADGSVVAQAVEAVRGEVQRLTDELATVQREKREKALAEKYPDILPELLIDKDDTAVEKIVEAQRERNRVLYGDSRRFQAPAYGSTAEIDAAIEKIQKDSRLSGVQKSVEVMRLTRRKHDLG